MFFAAGIAFLFLPDTLLPQLIPSFPRGGAWLGQLLAASLLGFGTLNWFSRGAILGGIYGRPVVAANTVFFFVSATSLIKAAIYVPQSMLRWALAGATTLLAFTYFWLMLKGPLESDFRFHSGTPRPPQ